MWSKMKSDHHPRVRLLPLWVLAAVLIGAVFFTRNVDLGGNRAQQCDCSNPLSTPVRVINAQRLVSDPSTPETGAESSLSALEAGGISEFLQDAILHYATSPNVPQQTFDQVSVTLKALRARGPCNLLVFGLGHDSVMWAGLNHGGRTVFLEHDPEWMEMQRNKFPTLEMYLMEYHTHMNQSDELMAQARKTKHGICRPKQDLKTSECPLALTNMPSFVYDVDWDIIMCDAPWGFIGFPRPFGRMPVIFSAAIMARNRREPAPVEVMVHDYTREIESKYANHFLCPENRKSITEGILAHYHISPESTSDKTFCS